MCYKETIQKLCITWTLQVGCQTATCHNTAKYDLEEIQMRRKVTLISCVCYKCLHAIVCVVQWTPRLAFHRKQLNTSMYSLGLKCCVMEMSHFNWFSLILASLLLCSCKESISLPTKNKYIKIRISRFIMASYETKLSTSFLFLRPSFNSDHD